MPVLDCFRVNPVPYFFGLQLVKLPPTCVPPKILMPSCMDLDKKITVSSPQEVVQAVDGHYSLMGETQQFVGGMGESDAGVWFVSSTQDPLQQQYPLLQESI